MYRGARRMLLLQLAVVLSSGALAYYVPGTYPQEYNVGDALQAQVNSLKSFDTEMPFEYYTLPFCRPPEGIKRSANTANPGTILEGLRIENSVYNFSVKVKETTKIACQPSGSYPPLTAEEVANLKHKIDEHYRINMLLDNLPVTVYDLLDEDAEFVRPGFELGFKAGDKYYINNHLIFNILVTLTHGEYKAAKENSDAMVALEIDARRQRHLSASSTSASSPHLHSARRSLHAEASAASANWTKQDAASAKSKDNYYMVVGFEVSPCSIAREVGKPVTDSEVCGMAEDVSQAQEIKVGAQIIYTYDVYWQDSNIKWASRWDAYLRMPGGKVHWFSIMNSIIVVLVMATMVAFILIRTVRRDLSKYEQILVDSSAMDLRDESGWKLVSGDVFRAPTGSRMMAVQIGSGVQIILTSTASLLLASMGFLSPASRGALLTTTMVLFVWLAVVAGFVAVYVWGLMERSYNGWPMPCAMVAVFFPGTVMFIFTFLNLLIHGTGTTGAVPIGMYFGLVLVWFVVSIPLTFVGGYLALKVPIRDHPVKTNQIPRHVPPPPLAANPWLMFVFAGLLPFGTIFIELYFAMTSIWLGYFYYLFGFFFLIGLLAAIINAEISVMCTYISLCAEDYRWWWQSFHRGGSVAIWVAGYALTFLFGSLATLSGPIPVMIYLCYMSILILGCYLAMGTVGWLASYIFVYYIFGALKSD